MSPIATNLAAMSQAETTEIVTTRGIAETMTGVTTAMKTTTVAADRMKSGMTVSQTTTSRITTNHRVEEQMIKTILGVTDAENVY
jgi:hypothetical protein